jgi:hypothetical protein
MFLDDWVFKNRDYGAYQLRKKYYLYTFISLTVSIIIFIIIFCLPLLLNFKHQIETNNVTIPPKNIQAELLAIKFDESQLNKEEEKSVYHKSKKEELPDHKEKTESDNIALKIDSFPESVHLDTSKEQAENKEEDIRLTQEGVFECGSNLFNFRMWFMNNFHFPVDDKIRKTEGRAIAVFIVNEKGIIDSVNIISGIDPIVDAEIKNTLLRAPRWKPCLIDGKAVKQLYNFPIYLVRKL